MYSKKTNFSLNVYSSFVHKDFRLTFLHNYSYYNPISIASNEAQQKLRVTGIITGAITKETLIGVTV